MQWTCTRLASCSTCCSAGANHLQKNPKQRLPPMRHKYLKKKLEEASESNEEAIEEWRIPEVGAIALLILLTSEDPSVRTTAREVKQHTFFTQLLDGSVDDLLTAPGPFSLP